MNNKRILYLKNGCPWCIDVERYLDKEGIAVTKRIVSADKAAMEEMYRVSGQGKAPTLDWEVDVLADFGVDELVPFLEGKV
jgi:glutaredoxin 3